MTKTLEAPSNQTLENFRANGNVAQCTWPRNAELLGHVQAQKDVYALSITDS